MKDSNFKTASFDIGLLFETKKGGRELERIFKEIGKISPVLDGVKKFEKPNEKRQQEGKCILTSRDNKIKVQVTSADLSIVFTNQELETDTHAYTQTILSILLAAHRSISSPDAVLSQSMRYRHLIFSPNEQDKKDLLSEYFKPEAVERLETADFTVALQEGDFEGTVVENLVNIYTTHPGWLHDAYSKIDHRGERFEPVLVFGVKGIYGPIIAKPEKVKEFFERCIADDLPRNLIKSIR